MKEINIGCGNDIRKGWYNLDIHGRNGADCIWDLNNLPLPFEDESFDTVYCSHVLEDFIEPHKLIDEFVRITKVGGIIEIRVPNETHHNDSIFHKKPFNTQTFKSYVNSSCSVLHYGKQSPVVITTLCYYGYDAHKKDEICLAGRMIKTFCAVIANIFGNMIMSYTPIKFSVPIVNIKCVMRKVKK